MNDVRSATPSSTGIAPVCQEIEVPCRPSDAFRMFTEEIGQWWPLHTHSVALERAVS